MLKYLRSPFTHTRPSDALSSLTGHSRIEAKKQNEAGSDTAARGYQAKSRMGAAC
jgi:hypothetical protein